MYANDLYQKKNPIYMIGFLIISSSQIIVNRTHLNKDSSVLLDHKITFHEYINHIIKLYKSLRLILLVTKLFLDLTCLEIIYFSHVRSVMEYCSNIWTPYIDHTPCIDCSKLPQQFLRLCATSSRTRLFFMCHAVIYKTHQYVEQF